MRGDDLLHLGLLPIGNVEFDTSGQTYCVATFTAGRSVFSATVTKIHARHGSFLLRRSRIFRLLEGGTSPERRGLVGIGLLSAGLIVAIIQFVIWESRRFVALETAMLRRVVLAPLLRMSAAQIVIAGMFLVALFVGIRRS